MHIIKYKYTGYPIKYIPTNLTTTGELGINLNILTLLTQIENFFVNLKIRHFFKCIQKVQACSDIYETQRIFEIREAERVNRHFQTDYELSMLPD